MSCLRRVQPWIIIRITIIPRAAVGLPSTCCYCYCCWAMIIAAVPVPIRDKGWLVKGSLKDQHDTAVRGQDKPDPLPHFFSIKPSSRDDLRHSLLSFFLRHITMLPSCLPPRSKCGKLDCSCASGYNSHHCEFAPRLELLKPSEHMVKQPHNPSHFVVYAIEEVFR